MHRVRHRRRLFGGRRTAEEVHQALAFPKHARCRVCGGRPLTRAITLAHVSDAMQLPAIASLPETELAKVLVQLRGSDGRAEPHVRLGVAYACKQCTPTLERTLARLPSWVCVEINRGPGPDAIVSGPGQ